MKWFLQDDRINTNESKQNHLFCDSCEKMIVDIVDVNSVSSRGVCSECPCDGTKRTFVPNQVVINT